MSFPESQIKGTLLVGSSVAGAASMTPLSPGPGGQVLTTDSTTPAGLKYAPASGGGTVGPAVAGQVAFFTGVTAVGGDAGLTYDSVNNALTIDVARAHSTGTRNTFFGENSGNF